MIWARVLSGVLYFLRLVQGVLLVYCVLTWFMDPRSKLMRFMARLTDPILQPLRALLFRSTNSYRAESFAPLLAALIIQFLSGFLISL